MTRKIIQIVAARVENNICTQCDLILHALCNDGTVWWCDNRGSGWVSLPDIPQPPEEEGSHD